MSSDELDRSAYLGALYHQVSDLSKNEILDLISLLEVTEKVEIQNLITMDNCHKIAHRLAFEDEETARGLYEELDYWKGMDKI